MSLEKALITNTETGDRVPVLFNPEEYTLKKEITYAQAAVPGLIAPLLQFVHGNMETLDMELLVDTYEKHDEGSQVFNQAGEDVRNLTRKVTDLMRINPQIHAPPCCSSPGVRSRSCVLASVSQRFIMFLPNGTVRRGCR
jgi:hypothetical protein